MTNIAHLEQAIRAGRLTPDEGADETLADQILLNEALVRRIVAPVTRTHQRIALVKYFTQQLAEQEG